MRQLKVKTFFVLVAMFMGCSSNEDIVTTSEAQPQDLKQMPSPTPSSPLAYDLGLIKSEEVTSLNKQYVAYSIQVDKPNTGSTVSVIIKNIHLDQSITIDPNPSGRVNPSHSLKFVAGDNLIVSWGCGTHCQSALLYSPQGELLTHLGIHSLSQNQEFAVTFASTSDDHNIRLVDLRSGQTLQAYPISDKWRSACSAEWTIML